MLKTSYLKYTGNKFYLSKQIKELLPEVCNTFFEPFCGSCSISSVARGISERVYCSDNNQTLIDLHNLVKSNPENVIEHFTRLHSSMNKENYYLLREKFNAEKNCLDFLVLNRFCFNGLIRYNKNGVFNSPWQTDNKKTVDLEYMKDLIYYWSSVFKDIELHCHSYDKILNMVNKEDFVFIDPPYMNTETTYTNKEHIHLEELEIFLDSLNSSGCRWLLTYDFGKGNSYELDKSIYKSKGLFCKSSDNWLRVKGITAPRQESFFKNY